jgi:hypothetical protein
MMGRTTRNLAKRSRSINTLGNVEHWGSDHPKAIKQMPGGLENRSKVPLQRQARIQGFLRYSPTGRQQDIKKTVFQ